MGGAGYPIPDTTAMVRVEAAVSVDACGSQGTTHLSRDRAAGCDSETADFALVALLPHVPGADSANLRGFRYPGMISELCPRWPFAAFGDEALPAGCGEVGPWAGSLVSVFVRPGS